MIASNHIIVPHTRRGSVVVVVLWSIALAALLVSSVQLIGYRQAAIGTEAVARVQARWAARGGIEYTIAVMADQKARKGGQGRVPRLVPFVALDLL